MRARVEEYIRSVSTKDFQWGEHDCIQFVFGLVGALTGNNPAAKYKGTYTDEFTASMILWRDYYGYLPNALEQELVASDKLVFGNIALVKVYNRYAAGILQDRNVLILHEGRGVIPLPLSCVIKVFEPKCRK